MAFFTHTLGNDYDLVLRDQSSLDEVLALTKANLERLREWEAWSHGPQTREGLAAFTAALLKDWLAGSCLPCLLRHDGQIIGAVTLRTDAYAGVASLGYWVDSGHEGHGAVRRACRVLINSLGESVARVEIRTATGNVRSRRLAERLGFELEGVLRSAQAVGDNRQDVAVYGLLRAGATSSPGS